MKPVQVSARHKLIGVPFVPEVRNLFPAAKQLEFNGAPHLVLPHAPTETYLLRKLGYDVPSPILSHYDWPGAAQPFDVQRKTCALITLNERAYVLNGMGTGKTKALLWGWDYLRSNNLAGKLLVLAPLSTLTFTWAREVFSTLPHRKAVVLHGDRAKRKAKLADPEAEIFILNHDGVEVLKDELFARSAAGGDIDTLVLDELAVFRNGQSARMKLVKKLSAQMRWVWGATGAPIPRSPTDAWAQAQIVTPNNVPKFYGRFRDELMLKVSTFKYVPKEDAAERAFAVLQPAVRYSLDDVTELPDCVERVVDVELGPNQKKIYKALVDDAYARIKAHEVTAANAGVVMSKLLQVALGWVYSRDRAVVSLDNDNRIQRLLEDIDASERKVLTFVPFKHALVGISKVLTAEGIDHACVSGDTPEGERAKIFNLFQNTGRFKTLVAHPECLAHGLTLTAADTVIWFAPLPDLEIYDQANARIRRVGQKHKQLVLKYQSTPVEKKIYKLLESKQRIQDKLLTLFEEASE